MAMTESSNLRLKARDILANPNYEGVAILVENVSMHQETMEYQTASALYMFCATDFPNCLVLMLLKVYRFSSNGVLRSKSISLLSQTLAQYSTLNIEFSRVGLYEIKPLLIECLEMQDTKKSDLMILGRIVSFITYNVMICDNDGWFELSNCILCLAIEEPRKAFHVFIDLPSVYRTFIDNFMKIIVKQAEKVLLNPEQSGFEDWILALETIVKMAIQLLDTELKFDLILDLLNILEKSVKDLVVKGMEPFLLQGLNHLESFLSRDKILYKYNNHQCDFVKSFMFRIKYYGTETMNNIRRKIIQLVSTPDNPATKLSPSQENQGDNGAKSDRSWNDHLKTLSSLEILTIFASNDHEERRREIAIRRLEALLSNHTSKKKCIHIREIKKLQPLLISCLKKGVSDSMFKVLGLVVNHVAIEMFIFQEEIWHNLLYYLAWQSKIDFQRALYIFQCLTIRLSLEEEYVRPVMDNLLPGILRWLNPPTELLVDNSCWVMAFTGGFCAALNLINLKREYIKGLTDAILDSVRKLVERKMEVGLVRRAFIDLERIVKKQLDWYDTAEYKFLKGFLWRLYAIEGMTWDSKIVLWRINAIFEKDLNVAIKKLPDHKYDWLNLVEDEDEDDDDDDEDDDEDEVEDEDEDETVRLRCAYNLK